MLDRVGAMAVFAQVVADGSFSAAAQSLKLTPSAVSKQIGRLEDRLGVTLFHRTTRQITLTGEGRAYHDWCRRILAEIDEAEADLSRMQEEPRGLLRVNAATSVGRDVVTPLVGEMLLRYPDLRVELTLSDHIVDLVREGIDVAVRISPLVDSSLIARKLMPVHRIITATPAYLERHGAPCTPQELTAHNCMIFEGLVDWRFEAPDGPITVRVSGTLETNDAEAMRRATLADLGIARIASFYIETDLRKGRLVPLLSRYRTAEHTAIHVLYPPGRQLSPKVRVFVDLLVARMRAYPGVRSDPIERS